MDDDDEDNAQQAAQEEVAEEPEVVEEVEERLSDKFFGSLDGPDAMYIKLISSDNHEFIIEREHALISSTIKQRLFHPEYQDRVVPIEIYFAEISSVILHKCCMYFAFKYTYANSQGPIPEFPISEDIALELLMAAEYLGC